MPPVPPLRGPEGATSSAIDVDALLDEEGMTPEVLSLIERFVDAGLDPHRELVIEMTATTGAPPPGMHVAGIVVTGLKWRLWKFTIDEWEAVESVQVRATPEERVTRSGHMWECLREQLARHGFPNVWKPSFVHDVSAPDAGFRTTTWASLDLDDVMVHLPPMDAATARLRTVPSSVEWVGMHSRPLIKTIFDAAIECFRADVHPPLRPPLRPPQNYPDGHRRVFEVIPPLPVVHRVNNAYHANYSVDTFRARYSLAARKWGKEGSLGMRVAKSLRHSVPAATGVAAIDGVLLDHRDMTGDLRALIERSVDAGLDVNRRLLVELRAETGVGARGETWAGGAYLVDAREKWRTWKIIVDMHELVQETVPPHPATTPSPTLTSAHWARRSSDLQTCVRRSLTRHGLVDLNPTTTTTTTVRGSLRASIWARAERSDTRSPALLKHAFDDAIECFRADVHPPLPRAPDGHARVFEVHGPPPAMERASPLSYPANIFTGVAAFKASYILSPRLWEKDGFLEKRVAKALRN